MTGRVTALYRYPIKSHGCETMERVTLLEGQTIPWDRRWAVAHEAARADGSAWAPCANFSRGSKAPKLMAISAKSDEQTGLVTLSHPQRPDLTFDPDGDAKAFLEWVRPLMPEDRAQSARILRVPGRGMTDTDFPSVSIMSGASHDAVCAELGQPLSRLRWRGNIWLDGLSPWEEFDWVGQTIAIGATKLRVEAPVIRCLATTSNPKTGERDADTLGALARFGHQDFGVYARVIEGGRIQHGDTAHLL